MDIIALVLLSQLIMFLGGMYTERRAWEQLIKDGKLVAPKGSYHSEVN